METGVPVSSIRTFTKPVKANQIWRELVEAAPDPLVVVRRDGKISIVNAETEKCFGYPRAELVGQPLEMLMPPRFREKHSEHIRKYFAQPYPRAMQNGLELSALRSDGTEFPVAISLSHVETAEGMLAICVARDMTEIKRTEALLRKLSIALEHSADSIVITNREGIIQYVNPGFENLTGYSSAEAVGKTNNLLRSGKQDTVFYQTLWQTILAGKIFQAEMINRKKNGELYYEEKTITSIKDHEGNITHLVSTGRDVSARVLARERLEHQVNERTRDLVTLYDVTTLAATALDLKTMLQRVLRRVLEALGDGHGLGEIRLLNESRDKLELVLADSGTAGVAPLGDPPPLAVLTGWVAQHGTALVLTGIAEADREKFAAIAPAQPFAFAGVPIRTRGEIIGTLCITRDTQYPFTTDQVDLLASIAESLGISIEKARLFEQAPQASVQKERARLARDLHDSVTQSLYSMSLLADAAQRYSAAGETERERDSLALLSDTAQSSSTRLM